jgi:hypothetical protein
MQKLFLKYWACLLTMTLFLPACQREEEKPQESPEDGVWTKVHYRASVSGSASTKATLDAIDRHYIFERDDLLYVVDKSTGGEDLYGFLYLTSGAGATQAVFEGDLMYFVETETEPHSGVFEPERPSDNLAVTGTLVSKTQRDSEVYTFVADNEGKIDTGPNFGDGYATTFKEAVRKYSTFTADATYGNPSFSLVQGTAFLLFSLSFDDDVPASLTVSVTNNNGAVNLFSHAVAPDGNHEASFVAAFPGGTITLSNAKLTVTDGGSFNKEKALASASLQKNKYYNVTKTFLNLDYFTIQAREAATTISFPTKYQEAAYGLQYSSDGSIWTSVSETSSFELAAGNSVMVRGKGSKYQNNDGSTTLFTSSAPCYIYGDIMSLFCDGSYNKKTAFGGSNNNALEGAFKNMTNLDIHPARPLLLSAQTLSSSCYLSMFEGCTGLTRAPEFNNEEGAFATNIPSSACKQMFKGCTSLDSAPELPATGTIAANGYYGMFDGCTAMRTPPSRLAVTPTGTDHFREMFKGCTSLLLAPELTAAEIKNNGCRSMFNGCTALTEAPELPATTVGTYAYAYMFQNCSSLTQGPSALPATGMSDHCYTSMFKDCALLGAAPRIDATSLVQYCFQEMFSRCAALRTAQAAFSFTGDIPQYACDQMFYNCVALTGAPEMTSVNGTVEQYGCWKMYSGCSAMKTGPSSLNAVTINKQGYYQMFYNCDWLSVAPSIEATTIGLEGCYQMFYDCLRLATPPASLPATTLGNKAYQQMFYNCDALTSIPDFPDATVTLPAGTDKNSLCYQMFYGCDGLKSLAGKKLFNSSTSMTAFCFQDMFSTCKNLATVPSDFLPATTLAVSCYRGMFQQTAITSAPDLMAPTLVTDCYRFMFNQCKSLASIICYCTTNVTNDYYTQNWLQNAKTTGEFHYRDGVEWYTNNSHGIPSGWTRHADVVQ